ncbi:hypothetical protein COO60DRAFT_211467 [Scenedesmus sp. NREL 46B-D3]|nr:hypothetical protein COO60DRAFT_211467 [Scenedesmus sp. NREL 46B-D3]
MEPCCAHQPKCSSSSSSRSSCCWWGPLVHTVHPDGCCGYQLNCSRSQPVAGAISLQHKQHSSSSCSRLQKMEVRLQLLQQHCQLMNCRHPAAASAAAADATAVVVAAAAASQETQQHVPLVLMHWPRLQLVSNSSRLLQLLKIVSNSNISSSSSSSSPDSTAAAAWCGMRRCTCGSWRRAWPGVDVVTPKALLQALDEAWLSRENVASHLQKYRLGLRKMAGLSPTAPLPGGQALLELQQEAVRQHRERSSEALRQDTSSRWQSSRHSLQQPNSRRISSWQCSNSSSFCLCCSSSSSSLSPCCSSNHSRTHFWAAQPCSVHSCGTAAGGSPGTAAAAAAAAGGGRRRSSNRPAAGASLARLIKPCRIAAAAPASAAAASYGIRQRQQQLLCRAECRALW